MYWVYGAWSKYKFKLQEIQPFQLVKLQYYQYTLTTTGNPTCSETTIIGQVTVAPNIVIDSVGIQAAVEDVSCSTAGFTPDGQIGHPVSNTLSSFITGGLEDTAQVDRFSIIGLTTNADVGVGDTYTISIDGVNYSETTNDLNLDGNSDQSISVIAANLALKINGGSTDVSAAANVGSAGSVDVTALVAGVPFTSTATHTTDNVIRMTLSGTPAATDVVTITAGGVSYGHTVIGGNTLISIAASLTTLIAPSTTVTATANGDGTIDIRTLSLAGFVTFSSTVSSSSVAVTSDDRSTQFTKTTIQQNLETNYIYSWTKVGDVSYTNTNLEITGLSEGEYNLTVSIEANGGAFVGCSATASFTIEKPTITIGTVSETCGGTINIPVSGTFTTDQMSGAGNILTAELFQGSIGSPPSYSALSPPRILNFTVGSLAKTFSEDLQFTGLTPGLKYRLEVRTNTCSIAEFIETDPLSAVLEIDESQITITDEVCAGDGEINLPIAAITGGSGSYDYQWTRLSPNPPVTYNVRNLIGISAGFYELTITDSNLANCSVTSIGPIEVKGNGSSVTILGTTLNNLENECVEGTDGRIEIKVSGTPSPFIVWEYLVTTSLGYTVSSSLSTTTLTPNRRNLLPADFTGEESTPTGGASSFDNLPAGIYRVTVYASSAAYVQSCAEEIKDFEITESSPVSIAELSGANEPLVTQPPLACSPNDILLGSIQIALSGGQPPYLYSLVGGEPTEPITGSTFFRDDLPAGTYDIVISDSSGCDVVANYLVIPTIVLTDPPGNPLVLTEGTITPIPCEGGTGQFIVETEGGYYSGSVTATIFPVRIVSSDGNYILNTSITPGQNIVVDNIIYPAIYTVTVTDESGCIPDESIDITITNAPSGLTAEANLTGLQDCGSPVVSPTGPTIKLTNVGITGGTAPYTILWQRKSKVNYDTFSISFTGIVSASAGGTLGVVVIPTKHSSSIVYK